MNLSISREDKLEETIDFNHVENIEVMDENGISFRVGDIYKSKKTILILVRVSLILSFRKCCVFFSNIGLFKSSWHLKLMKLAWHHNFDDNNFL